MVKQLKNKNLKFVLWWILLIFILAKLLLYLFLNKEYFIRTFDPKFYADLYSESPYVLGPAAKRGIGDDGLYTFAGYYYLFQKGDISSVNFEHPPLGKYLIGLSLVLFRNENIINIIYFSTLLFITYKLGKIILKDNLLSLISVALLSLDPLFLDNLIRSLLDLPFTLFFSLGIYFFLLGLRSKNYFYLSMFFRGMSFSTRFNPVGVIIYFYLLIIIFVYKRKNLYTYIISSFIIPAVYLLSHVSFFIYHPSLMEFLRHKRWMLSWFSGSVTIAGNIWRNIFTGYYIDTTMKVVPNKEWSLSVPMIVTLALIPMKRIFSQNNIGLLVLYGICVIYFLYITFLTDGVEKFIMPIYPLLCILAVSNIALIYSIINPWKRLISEHSKGN